MNTLCKPTSIPKLQFDHSVKMTKCPSVTNFTMTPEVAVAQSESTGGPLMPAFCIGVRPAIAIWHTGKKSLTHPARAKDLICHRSSTRSEVRAIEGLDQSCRGARNLLAHPAAPAGDEAGGLEPRPGQHTAQSNLKEGRSPA
jgi:hypothetical protein